MLKRKNNVLLDRLVSSLDTTTWLLAIAAIVALTPLKFVSFLIIIAIGACLLPLKSGVITRFVVSYSLVFSVIGLLAVIAWFMHLPLNASTILLSLVVLLTALKLVSKKHGDSEKCSIKTDSHELSAVLLAAACTVFIAIPVLQAPGAAQLLRVISAGGDNSAHINMVKVNDLNQGITYGHNNRVDPPTGALTYPQTWHFNVAFSKWMIDPIIQLTNRPGRQLALYYANSLMWFGILVFFITRLGLRLAEHTRGKKNLVSGIVVSAVCGGIAIHWLLQLFTYGFQTQTATLALVVAEILLLVEAFALAPAKRYPLLLLATVFAVSCNFVWVFVMPVTFGALGLCLLLTVVALKKLPPPHIVISVFMLGALALVQPILFYIYPVTYEFPMILQRGLINPTSMLGLVTIMMLVVGYAVIRWKSMPLRITTLVAGGALLFSVGLMIYQLQTIHELRYFYYKSTYTFIVIGGALLGAAASDLVERLYGGSAQRKTSAFLAALLLATTSLVWWQIKDPVAIQYTNGTIGGMSPQVASAVINQVVKGPTIAKGTTFIGSCNRGDDIRANLFVTSLTPVAVPKGSSFDTGALDESVVFNAIARAAKVPSYPITILSSDQAVSIRLRAHLGKDIQNITLIDLDATPETEPVLQCPDRIRDIRQTP
jgi:hypothetical protein